MDKLSITYLLDSTVLSGGVKVVFRQAEALLKRGHHTVVISPENYPSWFEGQVLYEKGDPMDPRLLERFDWVIGTSPQILLSLYECQSVRKKLLHLVQGYEGEWLRRGSCEFCMKTIKDAYSLPVPKITISKSMADRLALLYPGNKFSAAGQGLEVQYFFPPSRFPGDKSQMVDRIFLIGPLTISLKQIHLGLKAFDLVRKENPNLRIVRISTIDTRAEEEKMVGPIGDYHVHLSPKKVGEVFRSGNGILLSPSGPGEGFGLPPLEAMACGVPVVLTRIPSHMSFSEPDDYAVFVPHNDLNKMSKALCCLIEDHAERRRLRKRGTEVAALFSYERVAENLEGILLNGQEYEHPLSQ